MRVVEGYPFEKWALEEGCEGMVGGWCFDEGEEEGDELVGLKKSGDDSVL